MAKTLGLRVLQPAMDILMSAKAVYKTTGTIYC